MSIFQVQPIVSSVHRGNDLEGVGLEQKKYFVPVLDFFTQSLS